MRRYSRQQLAERFEKDATAATLITAIRLSRGIPYVMTVDLVGVHGDHDVWT